MVSPPPHAHNIIFQHLVLLLRVRMREGCYIVSFCNLIFFLSLLFFLPSPCLLGKTMKIPVPMATILFPPPSTAIRQFWAVPKTRKHPPAPRIIPPPALPYFSIQTQAYNRSTAWAILRVLVPFQFPAQTLCIITVCKTPSSTPCLQIWSIWGLKNIPRTYHAPCTQAVFIWVVLFFFSPHLIPLFHKPRIWNLRRIYKNWSVVSLWINCWAADCYFIWSIL